MFTQLLFNLPIPDPEPEPDPEPDTDPEPEPTRKRTTVIAWLKVMSEIQWNLPAGFHILIFRKEEKKHLSPPHLPKDRAYVLPMFWQLEYTIGKFLVFLTDSLLAEQLL